MRKHLLWATTILTVVFSVLVMVSDIVFRSDPETYKAAVAAGANPRSYDIIGTVLLIIWGFVAVDFWKHRWRIQ